MKPSLAYIDDDFLNLKSYKDILDEHFKVETFHDPKQFLTDLSSKRYDCIILDIHMPIMDGHEVFKCIRTNPSFLRTPVFFVSSNVNDEVKIKSFQDGAADFFDRLISKEELIVRLSSRIRTYKEVQPQISLGNVMLDFHKVEAYLNDEKLELTLIEFKILSYLLKTYPQRYSKSELVQAIWGTDILSSNTINTHLSNLRTKLADWTYEIDHIKGKGFFLKSKN